MIQTDIGPFFAFRFDNVLCAYSGELSDSDMVFDAMVAYILEVDGSVFALEE